MKYILVFVAFIGTFVIGIGQTEIKHLTVEPNHSTIGFHIPISEGITLVSGKFTDFDLELTYVDNDWTKSSAKFTIQAGSINTGIPARDEHLCAPDFFDVEKFPTITFQSEKIKKLEDNKYIATGTFTMRGVSQSIELPFEILGKDRNTIGIQIRTKLNRIDYGVGSSFKHTSEENFLAKEVNILINFWTKRDKRKTSKN